MNLVSHLWGYGNPGNPDRAGCVASNEEKGWADGKEPNIAECLASDIGCCSDFARVPKILLSKEGIEKREVFVDGHVFNEAKTGGGWITLDATMNLAVREPWEELMENHSPGPGSIDIILFPHPGLVREGNPLYRAKPGQDRLAWLLRILDKTAPVIAYAP